MLQKIVIALVGPQLAGKGTFTAAIKNWCGEGRVAHHCTGDILRSILQTLGRPQDRPDCDKLVLTLAAGYGQDFLAHAMQARILEDRRPVVIFDSMRLLNDEAMVEGLPGRKLKVYITAPAEIRYSRLSERQRGSEGKLSFQDFLRNEQLPMERLIHEIGSRADVNMETSEVYARNDAMRVSFCKNYLAQYADT